MSLLALASLFSGPNQTGSSMLMGLGTTDDYSHLTHDVMESRGLIDSVSSGLLICQTATINLVLFSNSDYTGTFFQLSKAAGGDATYWHTGSAQSALLIASERAGTSEHRFSFTTIFQGDWDTFLDQTLQGTSVSRDVDPLLTWRMFPTDDQWLSSGQVYLRIHQPLHVHMPWYWPDYQASVDYHILLYVTGDHHLRGWVADYEWWVESGAKSGKIGDQLGPQAASGMGALQDHLNEKLSALDALGAVRDVYYLPGTQLSPVDNAVLGGNTNDDITIVIVS
jgi:hypothetical protein